MSVEFPSFWRIWEESFPLHIQVFRGCLCSSSHMPSFCMCVSVYSVLSDSLLPQRGSLTVACQASLSMGFSRQEYWSGLPFPPPGDLPDSGIELVSPVSPALAGRFSTTEPPHPSSKPATQHLHPQCLLVLSVCLSLTYTHVYELINILSIIILLIMYNYYILCKFCFLIKVVYNILLMGKTSNVIA